MNSIESLLRDKIDLLNAFIKLNSTFINDLEIGRYDCIDKLFRDREIILEIASSIDAKLLQLSQSDFFHPKVESIKETLNALFKESNQLSNKIKEQDVLLLVLFESAKNSILNDLRSMKKQKKSIQSYKTKVDHHQIDEKA